jgi:hypothetical protein
MLAIAIDPTNQSIRNFRLPRGADRRVIGQIIGGELRAAWLSDGGRAGASRCPEARRSTAWGLIVWIRIRMASCATSLCRSKAPAATFAAARVAAENELADA